MLLTKITAIQFSIWSIVHAHDTVNNYSRHHITWQSNVQKFFSKGIKVDLKFITALPNIYEYTSGTYFYLFWRLWLPAFWMAVGVLCWLLNPLMKWTSVTCHLRAGNSKIKGINFWRGHNVAGTCWQGISSIPYIPWNIHQEVILCIYSYPSGLVHWHLGNQISMTQ